MGQITSAEVKVDLQHRLRRLEGQARGVQRMLDEGRDCRAILQQLAAIRAAANQASLVLVRSYATQCMQQEAGRQSPSDLVDELVSVLSKVS
jgi:DNA-binding FrmR family transcriptional regulator